MVDICSMLIIARIIQCAIGILSEYISKPWVTKLNDHYKCNAQVKLLARHKPIKRKREPEEEDDRDAPPLVHYSMFTYFQKKFKPTKQKPKETEEKKKKIKKDSVWAKLGFVKRT